MGEKKYPSHTRLDSDRIRMSPMNKNHLCTHIHRVRYQIPVPELPSLQATIMLPNQVMWVVVNLLPVVTDTHRPSDSWDGPAHGNRGIIR
jgi:hypothetical protein